MLRVGNLWLWIQVGFGASGMHSERLALVRAVKTTIHRTMDDMVQKTSIGMRVSLYFGSQGYLVRRSTL